MDDEGAIAVYELEGASLFDAIDWARDRFEEAWSLSASIRRSDGVVAVWLVGSDPSDRPNRAT